MPLVFTNEDLEYTKFKELRKEDVQSLKEWLQKQQHLPPISELELICFLQSCKFSIEMAKVTIDNYYTIRTLCQDIFGNRDGTRMETMLDTYFSIPLPKRTAEGYMVVISGLKNQDPSKFVFADSAKIMDVVGRLTMFQRGAVNGLIVIMDMKGYTFGHLARLPISTFSKYTVYLQEALPVQLKQIHYINIGSVIEKLMTVIKPLVTKELFAMMHLHCDYRSSLFEYVPKDLLPKDYGGFQDTFAEFEGRVREMVLENMDIVRADEKRVVDESKRSRKWTKFESVFGVEGSFKKLELD